MREKNKPNQRNWMSFNCVTIFELEKLLFEQKDRNLWRVSKILLINKFRKSNKTNWHLFHFNLQRTIGSRMDSLRHITDFQEWINLWSTCPFFQVRLDFRTILECFILTQSKAYFWGILPFIVKDLLSWRCLHDVDKLFVSSIQKFSS
jgi:hypothetical protein